MIKTGFSLILTSLMLSVEPSSGLSSRQDRGDVVFAGRLTDTAVRGLIQRLSSAPGSKLVITSFGGEEAAGVTLGQFVLSNEVPVVVRGICLSACANSVLIAASQVELEPGAVIAFHHSARSIVSSYSRLGEPPPADLAETARLQENIYRAKGVDIALLDCAAEKVGQMDRYVERRVPDAAEPRRLFAMRLRWWTPHQSTLERLGVAIHRGRMNDDRERVAQLLGSPPREIAFGDLGDCL